MKHLVGAVPSSSNLAARALLAALLAGGTLCSGLSAQVDFMVTAVEVSQAIQTGVTPLTAGRSTFVRTSLRMVNPPPSPVFVDALMRVTAGGMEIPGSPFFSDNGPIEVFQPANPLIEDHTLNFLFLPPAGVGIEVSVEVNPAGPNHVAEATAANNTKTVGPLTFSVLATPEMAYAPIDYRPGGGSTPNPPDSNLIEPGVGDNFIQGIYPSADWYYHRIDAPSKLWTNSLSGSGVNLLNSLAADRVLMVPQPDFLYGWVPGSIPYNGMAFIGGEVAMGNTQPIRHQRTFAHELGHNTGLSHNNASIGLVGVDVERHLAITEALPMLKEPSKKDIMAAGLLTHQAWVWSPSYLNFIGHPAFQASDALSAPVGPGLFVAGIWNTETGAVWLTDVLAVPSAQPSAAAAPGTANLRLRVLAEGAPVHELPIANLTSTDCPVCAEGGADAESGAQPLVGFTAVVPLRAAGGQPVDQLQVEGIGAVTVGALDLRRSAAAPEVELSVPADVLGGALTVSWSGSDADGDTLTYYLRYSPDGERFVPLLSSSTETALTVDLRALPAFVDGLGFFELRASDGLNTTVARSALLTGGSSTYALGGNPPWVEVVTPDTGTSHLKGATVILHSSGWDLEDRALDGASIQWSSDVNGALGSGRLTSTSDLSVGMHVLTVTASDDGGLQSADTTIVTIVDRDLPDVGATLCQTDLGFGGPGLSVLSVCGGDLSTGTTADLLLTDAPASTAAYLIVGFVNAPTPVKGGMLVPVPAVFIVPLVTDPTGSIAINGIAGGDGPATVYLQFALADPGQPQGYGFSNALEVIVLP